VRRTVGKKKDVVSVVPPPLGHPEDKVVVVAPAGPADKTALDAGLTWLMQQLRPVSIEGNYPADGYLAGTDENRRKTFQAAIDHGAVKAIMAARGGYGTTRILDQLDLRGLAKTPKWIVGSSDLTAVLIKLYLECRMFTIHGPMVSRLASSHRDDLAMLIDLLKGHPWTPPPNLGSLSNGKTEGPLIGGNLTILAHLAGTIPANFADGAILFLEDVGEQPYRVDRCLTQLKRAKMLENVTGIVLGEFTNCVPGPDGVTVEEVMVRNLGPLDIPVATGYPAAHGERNYPFVHGGHVTLDADDGKAVISLKKTAL
jgi:muramoyltetrapeptide carboxypeptidase